MQALSQLSYTPALLKIWVLKLATIREGAILMRGRVIVNEFIGARPILVAYLNHQLTTRIALRFKL